MDTTTSTAKKSRKKKDNKGKTDVSDSQEESIGHVIVQIPISSDKIKKIIADNQTMNHVQLATASNSFEAGSPEAARESEEQATDQMNKLKEQRDKLSTMEPIAPEPSAYEKNHTYESEPAKSVINDNQKPFQTSDNNVTCCYWCCHPIDYTRVSLPIRYDSITETFTTMGNFCSYECAAAYNFSEHQGTDRMWEIHSWLEFISERAGNCAPLRPAPSRYTLKMFGGQLSIQEFRTVHKTMSRLVLCNIPPLISVFPQTEIMNTSYMCPQIDTDRMHQAHERIRIKKTLDSVTATKKTLDKKMKLSFLDIPSPTGISVLAN